MSRVKFTTKVRRGLRLMLQLADNSRDPDTAPGYTHVSLRWSRGDHQDYDAARAWIADSCPAAGEAIATSQTAPVVPALIT